MSIVKITIDDLQIEQRIDVKDFDLISCIID